MRKEKKKKRPNPLKRGLTVLTISCILTTHDPALIKTSYVLIQGAFVMSCGGSQIKAGKCLAVSVVSGEFVPEDGRHLDAENVKFPVFNVKICHVGYLIRTLLICF